jgi:predicted metal-dependent peptidase
MFARGLGEVVILVDTSGSVYTKEVLDAFASELDGILQLCPCKAVVIYHHVRPYKVTEWTAVDGDFVLTPGETGGTSHIPAFEKIDELVDEGVLDGPPSCVVALTDMESSFPEDPGYPVLWASTGGGDECPFGTLVHVDLNELAGV